MKSLKSYLEQLFVTPLNSTGIGNVAAPSMNNSEVGSGDVITPVCIAGKAHKLKKKKKMKSIVEYLIDKNTGENQIKNDNKLTYGDQLKFSRWWNKIFKQEFSGLVLRYGGKPVSGKIYFDDIECVDYCDDQYINGVIANGSLTWGEAATKLVEYFKTTYNVESSTKNDWIDADAEIVANTFGSNYDILLNQKTKNIELTNKENGDKYIFYKRKYTIRRIDNSGRMSPVYILGDDSSLDKMISQFKAYSNKKYKYND